MSTFVKADVISEEEMIARICGGEKTLFHELIRPYTRIMFGYADTILRNPSDSEEAVQEAALKVFLNLSNGRPISLSCVAASDRDQRSSNVPPKAAPATLRSP